MTTFTPNNEHPRESSLEKATRRFNRKTLIDRSLLKRSGSISSEGSERSLNMFYTHSSKISNKKEVVSSSNVGMVIKKSDLGEKEGENRKRNEEEEFENKRQQEKLKKEIIILKQTNQELQLKLESVEKVLHEQTKKEGRHANKMRESIQKERMRELEIENQALKRQIEELKEEIHDARSNKSTEETLNSINEYENVCSFNFIEEQLNSEKEIFALNETIKSLHIEINSLKRRNHSHIEILKMNNEKEFRLTKEKLIDMLKDNSSLKKKNIELRNSFRKQQSLTCECVENKMERNNSLLSFSSDE